MILLLGTTSDDILYFKTKMDVVRTDTFSNNHPIYIGNYSGKEIALTYTGFSNVLSALVTGLCIEKYHPYIVIGIGTVSAYNDLLRQGDLILVERIYNGDIDLMNYGSVKYGQINDLPPFYTSEDDYINMIETLNSRTVNHNLQRGSLVSCNRFFTKREDARDLIENHFAAIDRVNSFDTELGGIASACAYFDVPWLALKSVNYVIGHDEQLLNFIRKGLESEPAVGSLISALFNNLIYSIEN